jgi:hypothetical protein
MPGRGNFRSGLLVLVLFAGVLVTGLAARDTDWVEAFLIVASGLLLILWTQQWVRGSHQRAFPPVRRLLAGDCTLTPRPDGTAEQLKQLGEALSRWWEVRWAGTGRPGQWIDESALSDLRAGELPQPFALRLLTEVNRALPAQRTRGQTDRENRVTPRELDEVLRRARETYPQLDRLLPPTNSRAVQFYLGPQSPEDLACFLDGLRRAVPVTLVESVVLHGQSWDLRD